MKVEGQIVVVTGGADGIGRALCLRFNAEGAKAVVVADIDADRASEVAASIGGSAVRCDVSQEDDIRQLIESTEQRIGPIALFCSNAGIGVPDPDPDNAASAPDAVWNRSWGVNVMAHVYAVRHMVPRFIARGSGYFLNTVSAAGLLNQPGSAVYSTTKHAAVGFAESLAITHRDHGIRVSILCPQGVDTTLLRANPIGAQHVDGLLTPEEVAGATIEGLDAERFLILPHKQVSTYMERKVGDYDRWIGGMAKLRRKIAEGGVG